MDLCWQSNSLLFCLLSRFVMAFLPRSKYLNFIAAVTIWNDFGAQENEVCHCFHCFPIWQEMMGLDAMILVSWMLSFKPAFSLSSFTFIERLFSSSSLCFILYSYYNKFCILFIVQQILNFFSHLGFFQFPISLLSILVSEVHVKGIPYILVDPHLLCFCLESSLQHYRCRLRYEFLWKSSVCAVLWWPFWYQFPKFFSVLIRFLREDLSSFLPRGYWSSQQYCEHGWEKRAGCLRI